MEMIFQQLTAEHIGENVASAIDDQLEEIVRSYSRFVHQVAYVVLRNHHDAEDIVQETFLRVMTHSETLPLVRNRRSWLASIAWRLAVNRCRPGPRTRTGPFDPFREPVESSPDPEEQAGRQEMLRVVEQLVGSLPEKLRHPLQLSSLEGLTSAEIGQVLGIQESSVRNRIFRARKLLKRKLEVELGESSEQN
jgi:RNA polymerase sigma-70 factor (ECF subfamily)